MPFLGVLGAVVFAVLGFAEVVAVEVGWERRGHRGLLEARGVGSGLATELGEVEIGASTVAKVHRLVEATFGVVAIEDDAVDGDGDDFDDNLDESTDKCPML